MRKLLIAFLFLLPLLLHSQTGSFGIGDAKSLGLGNTRNSSGKGITGCFDNPSMLAINEQSNKIEVLLPSISFLGISNSLSLEDIKFYFGGVNGKGRVLSDNDKNNLLNAFKNDGKIFFNAIPFQFGVCRNFGEEYGSLGFTVKEVYSGNLTLPKELADLALNGNKINETYSFGNLAFQAWHIRSYGLDYALKLIQSRKIDVFCGVALKYLSGFAWSKLEKINSSLTTSSQHEITGNFTADVQTAFSGYYDVKYDFDSASTSHPKGSFMFPSPVGHGFGGSAGITAIIDSSLKIGIALTDAGSIIWSKYTAEHHYDANVKINDLLDRKQLDSLFSLMHKTGKFVDEINTPLPMALRFGISYFTNDFLNLLHGRTTFLIDYNQGFNDFPANSKNPQFSFGLEWMPSTAYPYLLTGVYNDIAGFYRWSLGLGYSCSFLDCYVSTGDILSLTGLGKTNGFSGAVSINWKI